MDEMGAPVKLFLHISRSSPLLCIDGKVYGGAQRWTEGSGKGSAAKNKGDNQDRSGDNVSSCFPY